MLDIPIASYGIPVILEIRGSFILDVKFGFFGDLEVGFTTRGMTQTGNLLDGFYLGDNFADGQDKAEFGLLLEVSAGAAGQAYVAGYEVADLTVAGGLNSTFGVDLVDVDGAGHPTVSEPDDYRLYRDEILSIVDDPSLGMSCLFVLTGEMHPYLEVGYGLSDEVALAAALYGIPSSDSWRQDFPGLNWTATPCSASEPTPLADAVGDTLQMRPLAPSDPGQRIDVRIRKDAAGNPATLRLVAQDQGVPNPRTRYQDFDIDANGNVLAKDINGVLTSVHHLALVGTGNADSVTIVPATSRHFTTISVDVYAGDDSVNFGDYSDIAPGSMRLTTTYVRGGSGADRMFGTPVRDEFDGDADADTLYAFAGNDVVRGGDGDDIMHGARAPIRFWAALAMIASTETKVTTQSTASRATTRFKATQDSTSCKAAKATIACSAATTTTYSAAAPVTMRCWATTVTTIFMETAATTSCTATTASTSTPAVRSTSPVAA